MRRRQLIGGAIFMIWGAAIAIRGLVNGVPDPSAGSYSAGGFAAFVLAFVMIAVGARTLIKHAR
jgi:hypothetical protein